VSGLQPVKAGRVVFQGRDISRLHADRRARLGIRRSFQNLGLMAPESVLTNLLAAQHLSAGYQSWDLAVRPWRWAGCERRLHAQAVDVLRPLGLLQHLNTPVADLSFGTARFVELAAVMVEQPKMLLLDEPTTGLDIAEVVRLLSALREFRARGTTILLIAHDVRFVMDLCDYIYVLAEGQMLHHGVPSEVQRDERVIDAYLGAKA
jgi:branched-chain amino acid transport system ATP-binding protein